MDNSLTGDGIILNGDMGKCRIHKGQYAGGGTYYSLNGPPQNVYEFGYARNNYGSGLIYAGNAFVLKGYSDNGYNENNINAGLVKAIVSSPIYGYFVRRIS